VYSPQNFLVVNFQLLENPGVPISVKEDNPEPAEIEKREGSGFPLIVFI